MPVFKTSRTFDSETGKGLPAAMSCPPAMSSVPMAPLCLGKSGLMSTAVYAPKIVTQAIRPATAIFWSGSSVGGCVNRLESGRSESILRHPRS